ncbi:MAG TPA: transglutaminase family protein [Actinotalea sp.]|nr:transglutaminase family protein [Actinotalea sp.]
MRRSVSCRLDLVVDDPARLIFLVAVAHGRHRLTDRLDVTRDGRPLSVTELGGPHGTRIHLLESGPGPVRLEYRATVDGLDDPAPVDPVDLVTYLRPSRYAESDAMVGLAAAELGHLGGVELLEAVGRWVASHLVYVPGSSGPNDGASRTVLAGQGVCRDYAHVTVALLRALDVPARLVSVYAPGLQPMDFHAVAEAFVDGTWRLVDATHLAPRGSLVRIATGRDAADTAFLSSYHGGVTLLSQDITAVVEDGDLPHDDWTQLTSLR